MSLEERVDALERQVALLMRGRRADGVNTPWWKRVAGPFAEDPEFDEAMRLGREYRESLRPSDETGDAP